MIPDRFEYARAASVEDAVRLLNEHEGAVALAGGHSLVPMMKLRLARPERVVDLELLRDQLGYISVDGGCVRIGAMTRHHDLAASEVVRSHCGGLAEVAGMVGDPQVRHRGTIGGSVAHGDPAADLPTALVALDAELEVVGEDGRRNIPSRDFFQGVFTTALRPGELLLEIRVPTDPSGARATYVKFNRRAQDFATVGVFVSARVEGGVVDHAAVGLTHMDTRPVRATAVEECLRGKAPTAKNLADAAALASEGTNPTTDKHASASFRRHLAEVLTQRALRTVLLDPEDEP